MLSTSMVLPCSFCVRPASASSSPSPSISSSSATIPFALLTAQIQSCKAQHHLWYLAVISQITDPDAFHLAKQTFASNMPWEDIHTEFLDHFMSPEYKSKLQDEYHSFKAKPGETVQAIGDHLQSLCDQMVNKPSTPVLLHKFWSALPKDI